MGQAHVAPSTAKNASLKRAVVDNQKKLLTWIVDNLPL